MEGPSGLNGYMTDGLDRTVVGGPTGVHAGGVGHIHAVRSDWGDDRLEEAVRKIDGRVHDVLALARPSGGLPIDVAEGQASARLGRSVALPA